MGLELVAPLILNPDVHTCSHNIWIVMSRRHYVGAALNAPTAALGRNHSTAHRWRVVTSEIHTPTSMLVFRYHGMV